jgi:cell pole-organizing protein PopZ
MADEKQIDQEPSIEEILDSIRQIISDDDDSEDAAPEPVQEAAPPPPKPAPKEDVIELTEKIEDEPEPVRQPIQVDMKDRDMAETAPYSEPEPEPEPEPDVFSEAQAEPEMQNSDDDNDFDKLLTDSAENAALSAFSSLTRKTAVETHPGITIEDIVRQEMRPLLRKWLDRHLPDLVEKLVQKELERVSSRVLED